VTEALVMTHGAEVPNSMGLAGGYPGGLIRQSFAKNFLGDSTESARAAERIPGRAEDDPAFQNLGPKPGAFPMHNTDVFAVTWQGGGGLGDPIDRIPEEVVEDVRRGVVSFGAAEETYGVIVRIAANGKAAGWDEEATRRLRREIRASRLGRTVEEVPDAVQQLDPSVPPAGLGTGEGWLPLSDRLRAIRATGGQWRVETVDGAVLSNGSTRWREGAQAYQIQLPDRVVSTLHEKLTATGWLCPLTGHLLAVDIHLKAEHPFHDLDLDLAEDSRAAELLLHG
jgi:N-methylhydantoinase B